MAPCWLDGRLTDAAPPSLGPGCCTTGRYRNGRVRHGPRLAARLARNAAALGLGVLDGATCEAALLALGQAAFGPRGEGIVRLEVGPDASGRTRLRGDARTLGAEADPLCWRAVVAAAPHPGPGRAPGAKRTGVFALDEARREARAADVEEALLLDGEGRVVEGSRTSLVLLGRDGRPRTPPLAQGAVAGVAREILLERLPELEEADVTQADLGGAPALVAVNAVRGTRWIRSLDGRALGGAAGGRFAERLARILDAAG